jgi:succinoglycan biosynthesis transport protein ExoP
MSDFEQEAPQPSLNLNDILFILFKHKWKIFLCATVGIVAAASIYFLYPHKYESQAKLLVRYVVDQSLVDKLDDAIKTGPGENVIGSEVDILTSFDVAMQVAETVGIEQLLPRSGDKATKADAAQSILKGLEVTASKGSNMISVSYRNTDPKLVMPVLEELLKRYFEKHLEVHRSVGAFDFVTRQTDQLKVQLDQTEEELKQLKDRAGITSLAESTTSIATELTKGKEELDAAEAELSAQQARVQEIEKGLAAADTKESNNATPRTSGEVVQEYQSLVSRVAKLRDTETELLSRYTPQNRIVKVKQAQIDDLENQRRKLLKKYPGILAAVPAEASSQGTQPDPSQAPRTDLLSERARLVALEARTKSLKSRLNDIQERAKVLSELGPRIAKLERMKEVEETNYKYFEASLEKARIDETLNPSRMPNISVVQKPSPAEVKTGGGAAKIVLGLAFGGLAAGIAMALLIELVLDRTIKRSVELENRLQIPLLLSIPYFGSNGHRLRLHDAGHDSETALEESSRSDAVTLENGDLLRPFCEAIRDRLGLFFEVNNMPHRPKLVAVTGLSKNAGASMLAAGLASAFLEHSDDKVILVDKPVATKRIYAMMTQFKESNLDYVVFDLPALGGTSATLPLAGFMDTVLLVVEAEKSNRDAVKRAYTQLAAKTKVSVVFNKSRSYGPKWLGGEL